jgi:Ca2+-binding RTX toxin-like protein
VPLTLVDLDFTNKIDLETLVMANGNNTIVLSTQAGITGIRVVVGGSSDDELTFNTATQTSLVFAAGTSAPNSFDSAIISNAAVIGDAYFDGWSGVERLTTTIGSNITLGEKATAAGFATVTGGTGDDTFNASAFTTSLWINDAAGNNSLLGGSAANTLVGGTGNDNFTGGASNDSITGGGGADTFNGGNGNDTIVAGSGADSITGGEGVDSLLGGAGNDTFAYSGLAALGSDAFVDGGINNDGIVFTGVVSSTLSGDFDSAFAKVSGFEIVELATGVSNRFILTTAVATAGVGTIVGGSGFDTIDASTALSNVSLSGAGGRDSIVGGFGSDILLGGDGNDTIVGSQEDASLDGGADNDTLTIGASFTASGEGQIVNIENVAVTSGELTVNLGNQSEGFAVTGFASGATTFVGGSGADTFTGGSGADSISAGVGADSIVGGSGDDWLSGTSTASFGANQTDTLTGGIGADTFILGDASNSYYNTADDGADYALITDFAAGDKLQLKLLDGAAAGNGYLIGDAAVPAEVLYGALGSSNYYLYRDSNNNGTLEDDDNLIAGINSSVALTTANLKSTHGSFV